MKLQSRVGIVCSVKHEESYNREAHSAWWISPPTIHQVQVCWQENPTFWNISKTLCINFSICKDLRIISISVSLMDMWVCGSWRANKCGLFLCVCLYKSVVPFFIHSSLFLERSGLDQTILNIYMFQWWMDAHASHYITSHQIKDGQTDTCRRL